MKTTAAILVLSSFLPAAARAADPPSLAVADVAVFEGNSGSTTLTFVVRRLSTGGSGRAVPPPPRVRSSVTVTVAGGTATAGSDFRAVATATHDFSASDVEKKIDVTVIGDANAERDETLTLTLSSPNGATIADGTAIGTILNDDLPALTVRDAAMVEGNGGTSALSLTITRSAGVNASTTVTAATEDGSATAGVDYVARPATPVVFGNGETTKTFSVTIHGDTSTEPDETFIVRLSSPVGATIANGTARGTIRNDDKPVIAISDANPVEEGNSGTRTVSFTVTRTGGISATSSVDYSTANDTAIAPGDYTAVPPRQLSFAANQAAAVVTVTIVGDTIPEPDERFSVKLTNPVDATISDGSATALIENDDQDQVIFTINKPSVLEGTGGTTQLVFTVTKSGGGGATHTINFATADDTATAGTDYVAVPTTALTFGPNDSTRSINVTVNGDNKAEPLERLRAHLTSPGATTPLVTGTGTILDDDSSFSVNDPIALEGNTGAPTVTFTVSRTTGALSSASVVVSTADGSAVAGSDYVALAPTTLSFQSNDTAKTVTVAIRPDLVFESDETFSLVLSSPAGATIADGTGTGTIRNEDNPPQQAAVSINDISVTEGTGGTKLAPFTITRTGDLSGQTSVVIQSADGTARAPGTGTFGDGSTDHSTVGPITMVFQPNVASLTINASITTDDEVESDETFFVNITAASGATIADGSGRATIINDDFFTLDIGDATVSEGDSGTKLATFVVRRSGGAQGSCSVSYNVANGTATGGTDFGGVPAGILTFQTGQYTRTIEVVIRGDTTPEPDETFSINLSAPQNAVIADGSGIGTITNDDAFFAVSDALAREGRRGAVTTLSFTITLMGGMNSNATVTYVTANGTAFVGSDYVGIPPTVLAFGRGETSKVVTVTVIGDGEREGTETMSVLLTAATGATIRRRQGAGTILDAD